MYIRPNVVLTALRWLKSNNPLYANVIINNWLSDSANDDNEMFVGLFNTSIDTDNTNDSTCTNDDMIDQCNEVDTTVVNNNGTLMSESDDAMDINTSYINLFVLQDSMVWLYTMYLVMMIAYFMPYPTSLSILAYPVQVGLPLEPMLCHT